MEPQKPAIIIQILKEMFKNTEKAFHYDSSTNEALYKENHETKKNN